MPLVLRLRRLRPVRARARASAGGCARSARSAGRRRRADRARAPARRGRRAGRATARRRSRALRDAALVARAARPPDVVGVGDRAVGELPGEVVRRAAADARGPDARPRAHAARRSSRTACSRRRCAACASRPAARAWTPATLPLARELAAAALERFERRAEHGDVARPAAASARSRTACAPTCCATSSTPRATARELEPGALEVDFGGGDDGLPALELRRRRADRAGASTASTRGAGGEAIVYDYKGRNAPDVGELAREAQVPGRAVRARRARRARPRADRRPVPAARRPRPAPARARARRRRPRPATPSRPTAARARTSTRSSTACSRTCSRAVAELRAGALEPRPQTCGWNDTGCVYPDDLPVRAACMSVDC